MAAVYVCLNCGSTHGVPDGQGTEAWYWRVMVHGRVGPFHDEGCAAAFRMTADDEAKFSVREYQHLEFLRHLHEKAR